MTLTNRVLIGLLFFVAIYCCFLLAKNRALNKSLKGLETCILSSNALIERNQKIIGGLRKFEKAVKIERGDITIHKLIEFPDGVLDIEKINSISYSNIHKFLEDNPKIAKEHEERIKKNFNELARKNPYPTSFRGEMISGRENILKVLGEDIADLFFNDFVDKIEEHLKLLMEANQARACSFK